MQLQLILDPALVKNFPPPKVRRIPLIHFHSLPLSKGRRSKFHLLSSLLGSPSKVGSLHWLVCGSNLSSAKRPLPEYLQNQFHRKSYLVSQS